LFTGTKDTINFNTEPQGATIYIDGVEQCKTPCTLRVKRSVGDTDVEFKLDGYEIKIITLSKSFNIISILNLTDVCGWGIDAISGAVMKYDKKAYNITLSNGKKTSIINLTRIDIRTQNKTVAVYVMENK